MSMEMGQARLRLVEDRRRLMELAGAMQRAETLIREIQHDAHSVASAGIATQHVRALYDSANGALEHHERLRTYLAIMNRHLTEALRGLA